jgi:predicted enzyme related to lactoylglutathione lyase
MDEMMNPGAFSWNELTTPDPKAAAEFYGKLFGWETEVLHLGHMDYSLVKIAGRGIGGIMERKPGGPNAWTPYVTVENIDGTVEQAQALGAKVCVPPTDIPNVGRFAILTDPQGALIAAITYLKR